VAKTTGITIFYVTPYLALFTFQIPTLFII